MTPDELAEQARQEAHALNADCIKYERRCLRAGATGKDGKPWMKHGPNCDAMTALYLRAYTAGAQAEREDADADLMTYGEHLNSCEIDNCDTDSIPCSCGWDNVKERFEVRAAAARAAEPTQSKEPK